MASYDRRGFVSSALRREIATVRWIQKVGLAVEREGRLLVARKRGLDAYILPGGKPEGNETDIQTLSREIREELGCEVEGAVLRGVFKDVAAGAAEAVVVVRLYSANLVGEPSPCSEIEELAWVDVRHPDLKLAPSIENFILPFLRRRSRKSAPASAADAQPLQGSFEVI